MTAAALGGPLGFSLEGARVELSGRTILEGIDLRIAPGEAVALVGPSGAGKTTLLRALDGSRPLSAGALRVGGAEGGWRDPSALTGRAARAARARVGFIHQDLALVPNARVIQNVLAGGAGRQGLLGVLKSALLPSKREVDDAFALLERVGIGDRLYWRVDSLSGGERQRVAVARALYQRPGALLADEPVSSVDPRRAEATLRWLLALCEEAGLTLAVSLHDVALARALFPRLVGLRGGRIAFDGPPGAIDDAALAALFALPGAG